MSVAFSTLTTNVSYYVEFGGPTAPIRVSVDSRPSYPPTYNKVNKSYLVFKWNVKWSSSLSNEAPGKAPGWFQLHLYRPKGDDPGASVPPPPVPDPEFYFMVSDTSPVKEDSDLWNNYINVYYNPMPEDHHYKYSDTYESLIPERENTRWPGNRGRHKTLGPPTTDGWVSADPIPLRVATTLMTKAEYPHTFLLLLEIRRNKRLQLIPAQILVKSKESICFIATAAYGNPMSMELDVLRHWRDRTLKNTSIGSRLVGLYYSTSPPLAHIISRSETMRKYVRGTLLPIVNVLRRRHPEWLKY